MLACRALNKMEQEERKFQSNVVADDLRDYRLIRSSLSSESLQGVMSDSVLQLERKLSLIVKHCKPT